MAAGGPGDHPLFDVIHYNLEIYGKEADDLLKELDSLMSRRELLEWWEREIGWDCNSKIATAKIHQQFVAALERAESSGWEIH